MAKFLFIINEWNRAGLSPHAIMFGSGPKIFLDGIAIAVMVFMPMVDFAPQSLRRRMRGGIGASIREIFFAIGLVHRMLPFDWSPASGASLNCLIITIGCYEMACLA